MNLHHYECISSVHSSRHNNERRWNAFRVKYERFYFSYYFLMSGVPFGEYCWWVNPKEDIMRLKKKSMQAQFCYWRRFHILKITFNSTNAPYNILSYVITTMCCLMVEGSSYLMSEIKVYDKNATATHNTGHVLNFLICKVMKQQFYLRALKFTLKILY